MKKLILLLLVILFFGCAGTGPKYSELSKEMNYIPGNKARIVVFRPADSVIVGASKPIVNINNNNIGNLALESFVYADISAGMHFIETEIWDKPGSCKIALTAAQGKTYYFLVDLRTRDFNYFLTGGSARNASELSLIKCSGTLGIYPVDEDTAIAKLYNLRLNN
jgi:Protein of unknown function (DUF2846)